MEIKSAFMYGSGLLILFTLTIISSYILLASDEPIPAVLAFFVGFLFFFSTVLILKKSHSNTNLFFALSTISFSFMGIIASLGFINTAYQIFFPLLAAISAISPIGMYLSSLTILESKYNYFQREVSFILILAIFLSLFILTIPVPTSNLFLLVFDDIIASLFFLLVLYQFIEIRSVSASGEIKNNINLLIVGLTIIICGLLINVVIVFSDGSNSVIRFVFVVFGSLLITLSFTNIPTHLLKGNLGTYLHFNNLLEEGIRNIKANAVISDEEKSSDSNRIESKNVIKSHNWEFRKDLIENMTGLAVRILIDIALSYPIPMTNKLLAKQLKINKAIITRQIKKLTNLGYLKQIYNPSDFRIKPYILTEKGILFLHQLYSDLIHYRNKKADLSVF